MSLNHRNEIHMSQVRGDSYVLLDFNCSNIFTHHWSSLLAYGQFLQNAGASHIEFWVPKHTHSSIVEKLSKIGQVERILYSNQYATKSLRWPVSLVLSLVSETIFKRIHSAYVKKLLRNLIMGVILRTPKIRIQKLSLKNKLTIIVPTLDYMSLQLVKQLEAIDLDVLVSLRRIGSELKNPFSEGIEFHETKQLGKNTNRMRVNLGITTLDLLQKVQEEIPSSKNIYWCPLPMERVIKTHKINDENRTIRIGFPGAAKERKGTGRIPEIIRQLRAQEIPFCISFQKAPFAWEGYQEILDQIRSSGAQVVEMDAVLSIDEYEKSLNEMDIVYLPYSETSYAESDSGILYQASDREIPIICTTGTGFAREVFEYGIGVQENNFEGFGDAILKVLSLETKSNIRKYNEARLAATAKFIGLNGA